MKGALLPYNCSTIFLFKVSRKTIKYQQNKLFYILLCFLELLVLYIFTDKLGN
ncbi:hypothetical protein CANCADRAFT_125961 [Tortispora caseinolytica NRRL Y-17796]|uniref:Uncharacterized protein n=1 Tax=Tortispora caseinolytica NRRL Y-17796 TaxID=767744 RepID=A0A1E4TA24_9ASCO|nr:hypothetical protein CANCADRAFT_125961 [Tortispora caseinolytica NRRL Y-17796]